MKTKVIRLGNSRALTGKNPVERPSGKSQSKRRAKRPTPQKGEPVDYDATNQRKRWTFVVNNPHTKDDAIPRFNEETMYYMRYQLEEGDEGTPHFQGWVWYKTKKRRKQVAKDFPYASLQSCRRSPEENDVYTSKPEGRLDGPWTFGKHGPSQGERTDLSKLYEQVWDTKKRMADIMYDCRKEAIRYHSGAKILRGYAFERARGNEWRQIKIVVIWGASRVGKTRWVHANYPDVYDMIAQGSKWLDMYDGEEAIHFSDFSGGCPYQMLLTLLDGWKEKRETKGGTTVLLHTTVIFSSNLKPENWYSDQVQKQHDYSLLRRMQEEGNEIYEMDKNGRTKPHIIQIPQNTNLIQDPSGDFIERWYGERNKPQETSFLEYARSQINQSHT